MLCSCGPLQAADFRNACASVVFTGVTMRSSAREPTAGNGPASSGTDSQRSALQINPAVRHSPDFSTFYPEHHDYLGDFKRCSS